MFTSFPSPFSIYSRCCRFAHSSPSHRVFIGLGSNLGDRARHIARALLRVSDYAHIVDTSFLYQSEPYVSSLLCKTVVLSVPLTFCSLHVREQPKFLNAVAELRTNLPPHQLLLRLKSTESELGRVYNHVRYGPRVIDLDLLLYGDLNFSDTTSTYPLTVPHPRIGERGFVLRPLADLDATIKVSGNCSVRQLLNNVDLEGVIRVTPLEDGRFLQWEREHPLLMGIINTTPDSFSDGGLHESVDLAVKQAEAFAQHGFDIVDIGGYSTRPGAAYVDVDTEISRVLPVVQRVSREFPDIAISIDTFRGEVAQAALEAGANIVNDVGAGTWCEQMIPVVTRHNVPWIAMHCRGRPHNMMNFAEYGEDVAGEVARELSESVNIARRAGMYRWNIITDGGVGFAKNIEHNATLIREWHRFKTLAGDYPTLLGLSRKRSLAHACGSSLTEHRDWATAAALGMAISHDDGVDIVRVHKPEIAYSVRTAGWLRRNYGKWK